MGGWVKNIVHWRVVTSGVAKKALFCDSEPPIAKKAPLSSKKLPSFPIANPLIPAKFPP